MRLRYDYSTAMCEARFDKVKKLGKLRYVKGYRYFGRYYTTHEAVLVVGEHGSVRFGGLLWGYFGQGPRGLRSLLMNIGLTKEVAEEISFGSDRLSELGEDWRYDFGDFPRLRGVFSGEKLVKIYNSGRVV